MPIRDGGEPEGGRGFGSTSGKERKKIVSDVIGSIRYASSIMRNSNDIGSLAFKTGFHIDAMEVSRGEFAGYFKVDVQRGSGSKDTVAQVLVAPDVSDHNDIQDALEASLGNSHKWIVT